jgi:hypothetical protein
MPGRRSLVDLPAKGYVVTGHTYLFLLINLIIAVSAVCVLWVRARTQIETRRWMRYVDESVSDWMS